MYHPLWQLTLARLKEFFREPAALFWVYGFPLLLALALGFAFRDRPVEKIPVDVAMTGDADSATLAEAAATTLRSDERIAVQIHPWAEAENRLRTAKSALVVMPRGRDAQARWVWQYTLDPNRPECVLAQSAAEIVRLKGAAVDLPAPEVRTLEKPGGRYIDFLLPGLIGVNLMGGGLFGVGFVIVDMRVRKLLKRFLATPMRQRDFLLSILLSRLLFTLIEITVLLGFAFLVFGIRVQGQALALAVLVLLGGLCFAGIGLLIACRARTIETVSGLMNAVMLPMYVVSGVFFSSERFPEVVQPVIQILPLTVINTGLRAIMNDGAGFEALPRPAVVLVLWGVGSFTLALKLFRWR